MTYSNVCLVGLHNVADGSAGGPDLEAAKVAKVEAIKTMTANPPEDVDRYRAVLGNDILVVCRLYIGGLGNRVVSGSKAANDWTPDVQRFWGRGVRHYEIHNEPNLRQEGMWVNWQNGGQFANWWLQAAQFLRARFPGILLGWPGLSPGGDIGGIRYRSDWFLKEAKEAIGSADWVGAHCYEVFDHVNRGAGGAWREVRDAAPDKPLAVTEFSSPNQSPGTQAKQYRAFYEKMRHEPKVFAAFSFCVYGSYFKHEGWRTEKPDANGNWLTPIPAEVAKRQFAAPVPTPSPAIEWLPAPVLKLVDDKYDGAIIRYLDGREFKKVAPGVELAQHSKPFNIPGQPASTGRNRVIVNRELGLHILADRLYAPSAPLPVPTAVFAWPTEFQVVTQKWAARPAYYAQFGLAGHEGLDIRAPSGSAVFAVYDGTVIQTSSGGNYGSQIRLEHVIEGRKVVTVYAHLEKILVEKGQTVSKGQIIGKADNTGNSEGSHLHFGVRPESGGTPGFGGYVDPSPWLGL